MTLRRYQYLKDIISRIWSPILSFVRRLLIYLCLASCVADSHCSLYINAEVSSA